ncbi:MAG: DUF4785 domain-containing protein [Pseudomonadota bacterium]
MHITSTSITTSNPRRAAVRIACALAAVALSAPALAAPHELLAPQKGDLSASVVTAPATMQMSFGAPGTSHDTVALSWAAGADIAEGAAPQRAQSREYYMEVSAADLGAGVTIHTSAARALVRLQPLGPSGPRENLAIDPLALAVIDAGGHAHVKGAGMQMLVSSDKLAKADLPFAPGTSAFRLHPDLGSGAFTLKADGLHGAERYLINVVEPDSKLALTLQTDAPNYLHGHTLALTPELIEDDGSANGRRHAMSRFEGSVVSPGGRSFPLAFKAGSDGRLRAALTLDADEAPAPGLWEVRAQGQATVRGQKVMRTVRLAFPVAMPVARLTGALALANTIDSVAVRLGVEAGAPGRYEVRGLLYGTVNGVLVPLGVAHAAQWMEPGSASITLAFSSQLIGNAGAPFELRDLNLLDQGRMGVLHKQQRALVLDERDIVRAAPALLAAPATPAKRAPSTEG